MSERLGDLTSRERDLVDAASVGDVLECSRLPIEQLSATDDPEHTIHAELLRGLLLKRCDKRLDPRGVRLCGARITGTLDLTGVEVPVGVELQGCSFDHPVLLEGAHLRWLTLLGSRLPALRGAGLQVDVGLFLQGLGATGHGERGAVSVSSLLAEVLSEPLVEDRTLRTGCAQACVPEAGTQVRSQANGSGT